MRINMIKFITKRLIIAIPTLLIIIIINMLNLKRPIYRTTAAYGHFGRTGDAFTWEHTDHAEALRAASER